MSTQSDVVLHIPHSSKLVPDDVRRSIILSDEELQAELIRMTDGFTDDLFDVLECEKVVYPVSRLVVDPERFIDDARELMAAKGMGAVYTKTSDGRPLRRELSREERESLIGRFYEPHHKRLARVVDDALEQADSCLVLDCHSFPSVPLPYEFDQSTNRPDICLGTDDFHTPGWLSDAPRDILKDAGFRVELNRPFRGALVPMSHYRKDRRVLALMVEVNRSLYMNETTGTRNDHFDAFHITFHSCLHRLLSTLSNSS